MVTRQSELIRLLGILAKELPDPYWVALVDDDGLIVACVPDEPLVDLDGLSAMTATLALTGDRVIEEIKGGKFHFATISGSKRQLLVVFVSQKRFISIGLAPEIPPRSMFSILSRRIPEIMQVLQMRFTTDLF
jgi:predicted regulator of Ras-like GTPase activity (Roadblock/LC7/MglB family)